MGEFFSLMDTLVFDLGVEVGVCTLQRHASSSSCSRGDCLSLSLPTCRLFFGVRRQAEKIKVEGESTQTTRVWKREREEGGGRRGRSFSGRHGSFYIFPLLDLLRLPLVLSLFCLKLPLISGAVSWHPRRVHGDLWSLVLFRTLGVAPGCESLLCFFLSLRLQGGKKERIVE